ncbi:MAG: peptide deformylase [Leptolyngbyaceae cyanobacterium]
MVTSPVSGQQRPIVKLGDPHLRQIAAPVQNFDNRLQTLIDDLIWTAEKTNGVGIAAPQVGESLQLFIVASRPNPRYPDAPLMEPTAMVNPCILAHEDEIITGWEGCLSVPDRRGLVPRYQTVEVAYCDRHGYGHKTVLTGFIARIFQHEHDHLGGQVFLDRVPAGGSILSEAEYWAQVEQTP